MHTFLGLLGVAVFIPCVIGLAAAMTWAVVRYTPTRGENDAATKPKPSS